MSNRPVAQMDKKKKKKKFSGRVQEILNNLSSPQYLKTEFNPILLPLKFPYLATLLLLFLCYKFIMETLALDSKDSCPRAAITAL